MMVGGTAILVAYFAAFAVLAFFALHRLWLLLLLRRQPPRPIEVAPLATLPRVTVQLPVFNERFVVERLLDAVAKLDYPSALLEIQILDDSTDRTRELLSRRAAELRAQGIEITHVTREDRAGYKAGALAHGLSLATGELLLILDADFVPAPSLVRALLPAFADPRVAMVQARWGHLNHDANALTRAQALLLDAHFLLETEARARAGVFFNFHGTAGLWRRRAIEDAGGWSADTVTEDLDLSYRAQLAGWRFVYRGDVIAPAELPATLAAFRQQQARWAQGTIATARKHLRTVLRARLPLATRVEACLHLTCHAIYPATLAVALLALPALLIRARTSLAGLFWLDLLLALCVIVPTRLFYRRAAREAGTRVPGLREMPFLMLTGIALSVSNTRAVVAGITRTHAAFERTPKAGDSAQAARIYRVGSSSLLRTLDGGVAAYLILAAGIAGTHGLAGAVPAFAFLALGFGTAALRG